MAKSRKPLGTVEEVEAAFYDALSHADLDALMALWVEEEEIVCVHPGAQRLVGHAAIRASWQAIFERGSVHIRPLQVHAMQNLMSAVHNVLEDVRQGPHEGSEMHILATNVYLKTPHGWRLAMHHASVAPGKLPEIQTGIPVFH